MPYCLPEVSFLAAVLQLVPGRRRLDARLGEDVLVVEERDRVRDRLQAVELALVGRGVHDALDVAVGGQPELVERRERAGRRDLLQIGVVEHQHVRQRLGRALLQHLLDQRVARDRLALDRHAVGLAAGVEHLAVDRLVRLVAVVVEHAQALDRGRRRTMRLRCRRHRHRRRRGRAGERQPPPTRRTRPSGSERRRIMGSPPLDAARRRRLVVRPSPAVVDTYR